MNDAKRTAKLAIETLGNCLSEIIATPGAGDDSTLKDLRAYISAFQDLASDINSTLDRIEVVPQLSDEELKLLNDLHEKVSRDRQNDGPWEEYTGPCE